jgi:hypothetical protein
LDNPAIENCNGDINQQNRSYENCRSVDGLFIPYEKIPALTLTEAKSRHNSFISLLKQARDFKCRNSCIRLVEAEFDPYPDFTLSGWTVTDQITDADFLIDRMIIKSFSGNPLFLFDQSCKLIHLLSDRFSKNGTNIIAGFSVESRSYRFCDKAEHPSDYLGDYLTGRTTPSGNMAAVETIYLNNVNSHAFHCSWCNCNLYDDNHYDAVDKASNYFSGSLWYYYSMIKENNINRPRRESMNTVIRYYNFTGQQISNPGDSPVIKIEIDSEGNIKKQLLLK